MLMMIRSVVKLRAALEGIRDGGRANDGNFIDLIPAQESFDLLDSIVQVLSKFEEVSTFMSSESFPTICWVVQKLYFLANILSKTATASQGEDDDALR